MNEKDVVWILKQYPFLLKNFKQLPIGLPTINLAVDWLSLFPKTKAMNRKQSCYGIKHTFEADMTALAWDGFIYITEAAFAVAAAQAGFTLFEHHVSTRLNIGAVWSMRFNPKVWLSATEAQRASITAQARALSRTGKTAP